MDGPAISRLRFTKALMPAANKAFLATASDGARKTLKCIFFQGPQNIRRIAVISRT